MTQNGLFNTQSKVPSLVGVGLTSPYMRDGRFTNLVQLEPLAKVPNRVFFLA
tara:strand:- start:2588 stop:2743 length:156 start_codon:yes stop_codon:yes gene_type:complete